MAIIRAYLLEISLVLNLFCTTALVLLLLAGYGRRLKNPPKIYREETHIED